MWNNEGGQEDAQMKETNPTYRMDLKRRLLKIYEQLEIAKWQDTGIADWKDDEFICDALVKAYDLIGTSIGILNRHEWKRGEGK